VFSLKPESVFSLFQNRCSDWSRMGVQVEPEYAPEQFEILGNEYGLDISKGRGYINGKRMYSRIFIKNKKI